MFSTITGIQAGSEIPQGFSVLTQTFPPNEPKSTVMDSVPSPPARLAPGGRVHKYPVAPVTGVVLYETPVAPLQTTGSPETETGVVKGATATEMLGDGDDVPQSLEADT